MELRALRKCWHKQGIIASGNYTCLLEHRKAAFHLGGAAQTMYMHLINTSMRDAFMGMVRHTTCTRSINGV